MKACVIGTGIDKVGKAELCNSAQALKIFMLKQVINQISRYGDKTINGVVNDFTFLVSQGVNCLQQR